MDSIVISVIAAFFGLLIAVGLTLWWQWADRRYQRRLTTFQVMMRTRRQQLSPEWVGAFNLVPVEFAGHRAVLESFNRLLDRYSDPGWRGPPEQVQRAIENVDMAASELLHRMATSLRIDLRGLDLRRAYSPQGWSTDEDQNRAMRQNALQLLNGDRVIRVKLEEAATPEADAVQPQPPGVAL